MEASVAERTAESVPPRVDRMVVQTPLVAVTLLSKLSVPPFGAVGITLATPLNLLAGLFGLLSGRMLIDVGRLYSFVAMFALICVIQVSGGYLYSLPSLALMGVTHVPYVLRLRHLPDRAWVMDGFLNLVGLIAVFGIIQYSAQFVIGPVLAFPIENLLPPWLLVSKFNTQGILEYGSTILRTNGIVMLEPSVFSQLLGLGLVFELAYRQRPARMALLLASMVLSYSGTGFMLLSACLLVLTVSKRRWDVVLGVLALVAVLAVAWWAAGESSTFSVFTKRANEFNSAGSSGSMRFTGGFYLFEQFLWPDPWKSLFGFGAGSFAQYADKAWVPLAEMILFKTVFEFGIVGAIAYFGFLIYCLFSTGADRLISFAMLFTILLSGLTTPYGHGLAFALLIWTAPPRMPTPITAAAGRVASR